MKGNGKIAQEEGCEPGQKRPECPRRPLREADGPHQVEATARSPGDLPAQGRPGTRMTTHVHR